MIKIIIGCALWFIFGIYTGYKIGHTYIRFDINSDDLNDEKLDEIAIEIMRRVRSEQENHKN